MPTSVFVEEAKCLQTKSETGFPKGDWTRHIFSQTFLLWTDGRATVLDANGRPTLLLWSYCIRRQPPTFSRCWAKCGWQRNCSARTHCTFDAILCQLSGLIYSTSTSRRYWSQAKSWRIRCLNRWLKWTTRCQVHRCWADWCSIPNYSW